MDGYYGLSTGILRQCQEFKETSTQVVLQADTPKGRENSLDKIIASAEVSYPLAENPDAPLAYFHLQEGDGPTHPIRPAVSFLALICPEAMPK